MQISWIHPSTPRSHLNSRRWTCEYQLTGEVRRAHNAKSHLTMILAKSMHPQKLWETHPVKTDDMTLVRMRKSPHQTWNRPCSQEYGRSVQRARQMLWLLKVRTLGNRLILNPCSHTEIGRSRRALSFRRSGGGPGRSKLSSHRPTLQTGAGNHSPRFCPQIWMPYEEAHPMTEAPQGQGQVDRRVRLSLSSLSFRRESTCSAECGTTQHPGRKYNRGSPTEGIPGEAGTSQAARSEREEAPCSPIRICRASSSLEARS